MSLIERLEKYCLTPAMAGFEEEMIKKLKADLKDHVDEIRVDVLGNVIATSKGTSPEGSDLMIFAHTDSLGMIVKGVEENGFIRIERVGGVNPMGGFGTVTGVILATVVLQMVSSGFNALRFSQFFYLAAQGGVLIFVMILNVVLENRRVNKSIAKSLRS